MLTSTTLPGLTDLLYLNSPDGVFAMDREGRYIAWSPVMEKMTGVRADQVLGKDAFELFPFLKEQGEDQRFRETLEGKSSVSPLRSFQVLETGRSGFYEGYYSPLRDAGGAIIGAMGIIRDVTERAQRQASDELLKSIAESIPEIVWVSSPDRQVAYYNQRWYDYTGLRRNPDGSPPQDFLKVIHPDDHPLILRAAEALVQRGEPFEMEYRIRHHSGEYRWFLGRGVEVRGADGKVIRRMGVSTEIHAQKQSAEREREFNERFRAVLEQMPYTFQLYHLDGSADYANPAWERMWQSRREDLPGYNVLKDPHVDRPGVREEMARAFRGEPVSFPDTYLDPGAFGKVGRPRWIRPHFFPILDESGKPVRIAQMVEDVTAHRQLHERDSILNEASKVLSSSLDVDRTIEDISRLCATRIADICMIDLLEPDGTLRRVTFTTFDPELADLVEPSIHMPPVPSERDTPALRAVAGLKTVHLAKFDREWARRAQIDPGRREIMLKINPNSLISIPLVARGHALGAMTVIHTQRSRRIFTEAEIGWLEEIAERTAMAIDNARLYRASRQAVVARDTFMSTASHELKTPLTALQLQLKFIGKLIRGQAGEPASTARVQEFTEQSDRQIQRLARLVDDMLDISRIASGRLRVESESLDLTDLTREVCERLQPLARDYRTKITLVPSAAVYGEWDGHRIEQVLTNLLTNAFRYGGRDPIEVRVWEEGENAFISVRDRGRGIAPEDQKRIFERFERAVHENEVSGFGLGLFIAKEIVALHQGSIDVQSTVGQGATFTVRLPLPPPLE